MQLAEYPDQIEVCPDCGETLREQEGHPAEQDSAPWRRVLVSFGVVAVFLLARMIPLPTLTRPLHVPFSSYWSIMALGFAPLLTGYMIVEFAALIVPDWRSLRVGSPSERASLHRSALFVGMFLAFVQGIFFTLGLETTGAQLLYGSGLGFRALTLVTYLGATAFLVVLVRLVDAQGLGNGFAILLLASGMPSILESLRGAYAGVQSGALSGSDFVNHLLIIAAQAGAALWLFSSQRLPTSGASTHPALISRPACGVSPLTLMAFVFSVATSVASQLRMYALADAIASRYLVFYLAGCLVFAVVCAYLFNQPDYIAMVWKALSPGSPVPQLKTVMLESVLFIALLALTETWAAQHLGNRYRVSAVTVVFVAGILYDLAREWRAYCLHRSLTSVWEIHQTYAVAPTLEMLQTEGIEAFAKGRQLRGFLQFFGPYVPIEILVPSEKAGRAYQLLRERWPKLSRTI